MVNLFHENLGKIGFAGGAANSHYQIAKFFVREGYNAFFIHKRDNNFAFSHPIWEEVPFTLSYEETMTSFKWDRDRWLKLERQLGWKAPEWLIDPYNIAENASLPAFIGINNMLYWLVEKIKPVFKKMRYALSNADFLVVGLGWAEIIAPFTGVPYIIWPSGGDMREAAGQYKGPYLKNINIVSQWIRTRLLKSSFEKASFIASHNPLGIGAFNGCQKLNLRGFEYSPLPVEPRPIIDQADREYLKKDIVSRINVELPKSEIILFIPSRLDFFWKGIDKFLRAFIKLKSNNIGLLCSGWGVDRAKAIDMIKRANMENKVKFLRESFSKPLLLDMFRAVDIVVDQFNLGAYGSIMLEAMSVGTPVMMWIDEKSFQEARMPVPPVLNAKDEDEILNLLTNISNGKVNLENLRKQSLEWIDKVHNYKKVIPSLIEKIKNYGHYS